MNEAKQSEETASVTSVRVEGDVMPRFRLEERSGIIAVYDTRHPGYRELPGCHGDYEWCVAAWYGTYDSGKGWWGMRPWQMEKARILVDLLNELHNRY